MSRTVIYTLGPEGTFSERAALTVRRRMDAESSIKYCSTLLETVQAVEKDTYGMAMAPIENSRTGTVAIVQDAILHSNLRIVAEVSLSVRFDCVSNVPLDQVREIFVHPVTEAQCLEFLSKIGHAQIITVRSNADAMVRFGIAHEQGVLAAAIVPAPAVNASHLHLSKDVQSGAANVTRFVLLRNIANAPALDYGLTKTSVAVEPRGNRPGLLKELLEPFERFGINICRLESRPNAELWSYRFFLDLENGNKNVRAALQELKDRCHGVRVLGTYSDVECGTPTWTRAVRLNPEEISQS